MHKNGRQMKYTSASQQGGCTQKRSIMIVAPHHPKENVGVVLIHQHSPGGGRAPQSCCFFSACNLPADLRLQISTVFYLYAQVSIYSSKSYPPMVIGPLTKYPKPPLMPCFKMVLDTLERPPLSPQCLDLT